MSTGHRQLFLRGSICGGRWRGNAMLAVTVCLLFVVAGCAFNISTVKQQPVTFIPQVEAAPGFILMQDVKAKLGTGFPTQLRRDTRWRAVGTTQYGTVFVTKDQIVTVEESNIHEAQLVVSNQWITGFYLPVENKFAPASHPIPIKTKLLDKSPEEIP
jgi:hypothetical protein